MKSMLIMRATDEAYARFADVDFGEMLESMGRFNEEMISAGVLVAAEGLRSWRDLTGAIAGPFEAWLAHRSLATLDVRHQRQCANALALAHALEERDDAYRGYNPPSLRGVYDKDPYLHDGRSKTLRDALADPHSPDMVTGRGDLSDAEMDDLIAYLKSL